ncbi:MAG: type II toxin-antitoxin system VapC family toxin [Deltaproteobacteria bacterium]|nr:type II toxin-antitoxin system VapC family toxin [Deltaproteobacteria bacterium]
MADYILDTHACIFALSTPKKLGNRARKVLRRVEMGQDVAWIPAAVIAEIVLLYELRRISIAIAEFKIVLENNSSLRFLPLDFKQLEDFAVLSSIREPFDRLIIAAARALNGKLITKDRKIEESKLVPTIWD